MSGLVLRGGRDTVPVPGTWAVVHRITRDSSGPVDSTRTDARGRYRIRLAPVDTGGVYVTSAFYDSIVYFSRPITFAGRTSADVDPLMVYPTTRGAPPIRLARRLLTVARPGENGAREVLEILELENTGLTTRVTDDTLTTTWLGALPPAALQFEAGEGDISAEAIARRGDSVRVFGPIPPGAGKQLSYGYLISAGTQQFVVPIDQSTGELNLLLEDTSAVVTAPGGVLDPVGLPEIEGRHFAAYRTGPLAAGARVTIALPRGALRPQALVPYLVALLALAMAGALVWALKRKPSPRTLAHRRSPP